MKYELYADSLLFVNFAMNLYLLFLVDRSRRCRSSAGRLFLGALFGACSFFLPFVLPGNLWIKMGTGMFIGAGGMILFTFRARSLKVFLQILEKLLLYAFFLGGLCLFVLRRIPPAGGFLYNIFGVAALGGAACLLLLRFIQGRKQQDICEATLVHEKNQVKLYALIDTGNSLREPISKKPVSIISREVFEALWQEEAAFRVIPYHSIGKRHGLLQGYLLSGLYIRTEDEEICCRDVYVAVSTGLKGEKVGMILHPGLLEGEGHWGNGKNKAETKRNQKQEKRLAEYDIKSDDTGETAVQGDSQGEAVCIQKGRDSLYRRRGGTAASVRIGKGKSGNKRFGDRIRG